MELPAFEEFWEAGRVELPTPPLRRALDFAALRADPAAAPLPTPSGRIELASATIAGFGYDDCPGHPAWMEPAEWLGSELARRFPLHLISNQPSTRLHSQYDNGSYSQDSKVSGREPIRLHPDDAQARGIADGDVVRVFNDRGACLAGAVLDANLRRSVVQLSTGAWWDPVSPGDPSALDRHGNPNVLTLDKGTSRLAQGPVAQTALVELERYDGPLPAVRGVHAARAARDPAVKVTLAYGSDGLTVDLPEERTTVVEPLYPLAADDERAAVLEALRRPVAGPPLREVVRGRRTVAISICDGTRPQPRQIVVPAILEELDGLVRLEDVVVLVATGTHRGNTDAELRSMLGDEVLASVRVVNHDARDESALTWMGRFGADVPVWLNSEWARADVRITTGFVEPHFFAGFSGGPKLVAPGLAGLETTLVLHDAARIGHPDARWGVTHGNPVHDDVRAIAAATGTALLARRGARRRSSHRAGVRRRDVRDARGRVRLGAANRDARGPGAVRRRAHDQLRLPARPEPLPGGQGHVRGGAGRAPGWRRSCAPPSAATASPRTAPIARN